MVILTTLAIVGALTVVAGGVVTAIWIDDRRHQRFAPAPRPFDRS